MVTEGLAFLVLSPGAARGGVGGCWQRSCHALGVKDLANRDTCESKGERAACDAEAEGGPMDFDLGDKQQAS